jgi:cell division protease FtsH
VMAATNRPDILDPALIRPGRFDRQITLDLPQKNARKEILEVHTRKVPLGEDVDLDLIAKRTVGFSGADLKNLVNESALLAARKDKKKVEAEDFDQGRDKILMGIEREDVMKDDEKETVAYHEAGHALLAKILPGADPLEKVSIIPRGRSLGATEQIPEEDRHNLSREYLLNRVAIMLGGRVAEKITKEDISTGAGDDLKKATELVRRMVCQWGMSEKLGAVAFRQGETHPFLGREIAQPKDFSERTAQLIDEEIRSIIQNMETKADEVLRAHRKDLDILARALHERETLSREEVEELLGNQGKEEQVSN